MAVEGAGKAGYLTEIQAPAGQQFRQSHISACCPACASHENRPPHDPDLARLIDAWPALAEPIRKAMLALIECGK
jgi:hypothetical protein